MSTHIDPNISSAAGWRAGRSVGYAQQQPIVIGLVNNMPDAALRATEQQFCTLLHAASRDFVVRLKLFSHPRIQRSAQAMAHIERYYDDYGELEDIPPDGLIVTGMEPCARRLTDEPLWPALARLVDWTRESGVSTVWSCLAAHAAVMRRSGIERVPLGAKLSGLFECRFHSAEHEIVYGTPDRWCVPHSRLNGLCDRALTSAGYQILSWSAEAGADIFIRQERELSIFVQSHPEYGPSTLRDEYRRDVARFLDGKRDSYPDIPKGYFSENIRARLAELGERAKRDRVPGLLDDVSALLSQVSPDCKWSATAVRIYANWLRYLDDRRSLKAWRSFAASV